VWAAPAGEEDRIATTSAIPGEIGKKGIGSDAKCHSRRPSTRAALLSRTTFTLAQSLELMFQRIELLIVEPFEVHLS
jgi:hypothetical protein